MRLADKLNVTAAKGQTINTTFGLSEETVDSCSNALNETMREVLGSPEKADKFVQLEEDGANIDLGPIIDALINTDFEIKEGDSTETAMLYAACAFGQALVGVKDLLEEHSRFRHKQRFLSEIKRKLDASLGTEVAEADESDIPTVSTDN